MKIESNPWLESKEVKYGCAQWILLTKEQHHTRPSGEWSHGNGRRSFATKEPLTKPLFMVG
jgi:hypothetical protein